MEAYMGIITVSSDIAHITSLACREAYLDIFSTIR